MKDAVGLEVDTKSFQGGISAMFGMDDEVAPAQVIANFARTRELVKIFGGVLEGAFIDSAKVKQLSALPVASASWPIGWDAERTSVRIRECARWQSAGASNRSWRDQR